MKKELFNIYLEDPLLIEKNYISPDRKKKLTLFNKSSVKIIEVIKYAINGTIDNETENSISRKINKYLNNQEP